MQAKVGDRIVVPGLHVGDEARRGVILEVHGQDGQPPYVVGWGDGHTAIYFPAVNAHIEPKATA